MSKTARELAMAEQRLTAGGMRRKRAVIDSEPAECLVEMAVEEGCRAALQGKRRGEWITVEDVLKVWRQRGGVLERATAQAVREAIRGGSAGPDLVHKDATVVRWKVSAEELRQLSAEDACIEREGLDEEDSEAGERVALPEGGRAGEEERASRGQAEGESEEDWGGLSEEEEWREDREEEDEIVEVEESEAVSEGEINAAFKTVALMLNNYLSHIWREQPRAIHTVMWEEVEAFAGATEGRDRLYRYAWREQRLAVRGAVWCAVMRSRLRGTEILMPSGARKQVVWWGGGWGELGLE